MWPAIHSHFFCQRHISENLVMGARVLPKWFHEHFARILYLSNPKAENTTGGSGRGGARREGRAGRGGAGRDAGWSVRPGYNGPSCPPGHRRQIS